MYCCIDLLEVAPGFDRGMKFSPTTGGATGGATGGTARVSEMMAAAPETVRVSDLLLGGPGEIGEDWEEEEEEETAVAVAVSHQLPSETEGACVRYILHKILLTYFVVFASLFYAESKKAIDEVIGEIEVCTVTFCYVGAAVCHITYYCTFTGE